jgi:rhodanese-related sulfurtransferase
MIEIMLASGALGLAAAAWVKASGMSSKVDDAGANARREVSNAREELGAALEVQKELLARLAGGETLTKQMVLEGQLFQDVNGKFAEELYAAGGLYVLDVREPHETAGGILPGAKEIPVDSIPQRFSEVPRDTPVLIYCAAGARSAAACEYLAQQGYGPLYNLEAGYGSWAGATEKPAG